MFNSGSAHQRVIENKVTVKAITDIPTQKQPSMIAKIRNLLKRVRR